MIQRKPAKVVVMVEQAVRHAPKNADPRIAEVAGAMGLSARSLQRHLAKQGTSFSRLIERTRRQHALELLVQDDLNISEIAQALGYTDPSNFCRAFHKWTGQSPKRCQSKMLEKALPGRPKS
ncbi:helix-turn-helix transcriptional regulator [Sulfitobacter sp. TBRI5]|uniref:helix-turn-helix transcriptional regulator n=1 Tax=Sulfitobacter sp. TBRI5 TaxID=2989732 RepID=UPI003D9B5F76